MEIILDLKIYPTVGLDKPNLNINKYLHKIQPFLCPLDDQFNRLLAPEL